MTATRRQTLSWVTLLGLGLGLGLVPGRPQAQVVDLNDAINKAGRQRMLSQRLAKCYMALGQGVQPDFASRLMADSMALFDRQLVELKAFAPNPDIKQTYGQLEGAWSDYKGALVGVQPSRSGGSEIVKQAASVLLLAHQGTVQLEAVSGKPLGKLVNIAGRQRMLSQRMAAFYLGGSWGVQPATAAAEIGKARSEFLQAHEQLKAAPEVTPGIKAELLLAEQQWVFFDQGLRTLQAGASAPRLMTDVFTSSERILQVMDKITGLYARVA